MRTVASRVCGLGARELLLFALGLNRLPIPQDGGIEMAIHSRTRLLWLACQDEGDDVAMFHDGERYRIRGSQNPGDPSLQLSADEADQLEKKLVLRGASQ